MNSTSNCPPSVLPEAKSYGTRDSLPITSVSSASVPDGTSTLRTHKDAVGSSQLLTTPRRKAGDKHKRQSFLGKVGGILHKPFHRSASGSSAIAVESSGEFSLPTEDSLKPQSSTRPQIDALTPNSPPSVAAPVRCHTVPPQPTFSTVKETDRIFLEYDPILKRKVLNSYEILEEIGRGEHGRVKLAVDLRTDELVAIKIVNRSSRKDRRLRMRRSSSAKSMLAKQHNNSELKKKIEIAIMKKCHHKHIVQLKEVLDDKSSHKIYLVLEYLEKGEIKWKKRGLPAKLSDTDADTDPNRIPCIGSVSRTLDDIDDEEELLLSDEYQPNLNFKQCRKIFRDVVLGLEYLHLQGIVHRDVKPANLLVSADDNVKISDFGVSFASSLSEGDLGSPVDEWDLAKTAGTPAFFAPELCQTNNLAKDSPEVPVGETSASAPNINYKIDIWALGVSLYCLLFGKVPFNADSEWDLFKVIVNDSVAFPESPSSFNSPGSITEKEFELAKDLLSKMLDKCPDTRIEIADIKVHPFTMMDLDTNLAELHEFVFLNSTCQLGLLDFTMNWNKKGEMVTKDEIDNAVIGVGSRIKRGLARAITANGGSELDVKSKFSALQMEQINSMSSEDSSVLTSSQSPDKHAIPQTHSLILSDAAQSIPSSISSSGLKLPKENLATKATVDVSTSLHLATRSEMSVHGSSTDQDTPYTPDFSLSRVSSPGRRRGNSVLTEAPQIETKRNVGGDVYLKNQDIIETFKGIQQQDNRRRRSSNFKSSTPSRHNSKHSFSSSAVPLAVNLCHNEQLSRLHTHATLASSHGAIDASPITMSPLASKEHNYHSTIKVGPININNRRPSSVMSLPLSESYALLDSFNDDILRVKFEQYTHDRQQQQHQSIDESLSVNKISLESDQATMEPTGLTKRLQQFNITEAMSDESLKQRMNQDKLSPADGDRADHHGVAPNVVSPRKSFSRGTSFAQLRSASVSSSSSTDSESDEEAGNLTLAFSSKLALPGRPRFMDMSNRSISYDSSLPQLLKRGQGTRDLPVVYNDVIPEVEDLPSALISNIPRPSVSAAPEMTLTHSLASEQESVTTIKKPTGAGASQSSATDAPSHKSILGSIHANAEGRLLTGHANDIVRQMESASKDWAHTSTSNNVFNNHYKKEPVYSAFPNAIHMDNNQEALINAVKKKHAQIRPNCPRSQSVTIALLGPRRNDWDHGEG